jgi:hypothetical protein
MLNSQNAEQKILWKNGTLRNGYKKRSPLTRRDLRAGAEDRRGRSWRRPRAAPPGHPSRPLHRAGDPTTRIHS